MTERSTTGLTRATLALVRSHGAALLGVAVAYQALALCVVAPLNALASARAIAAAWGPAAAVNSSLVSLFSSPVSLLLLGASLLLCRGGTAACRRGQRVRRAGRLRVHRRASLRFPPAGGPALHRAVALRTRRRSTVCRPSHSRCSRTWRCSAFAIPSLPGHAARRRSSPSGRCSRSCCWCCGRTCRCDGPSPRPRSSSMDTEAARRCAGAESSQAGAGSGSAPGSPSSVWPPYSWLESSKGWPEAQRSAWVPTRASRRWRCSSGSTSCWAW